MLPGDGVINTEYNKNSAATSGTVENRPNRKFGEQTISASKEYSDLINAQPKPTEDEDFVLEESLVPSKYSYPIPLQNTSK